MTALGLDLAEQLPDGWTPLEAVVIAKCLDEDGDVAMFTGTGEDDE